MNELGENILEVMEASTLGKMSIHVLKKQSKDLSINLDTLSRKDLRTLIQRLEDILPFFLGEESKEVLAKMRKIETTAER
ncbi:MAG: hypothetical protein AYK23_01850 [Candidatus Proteinoplasmatales archaeon SG8-5]|nr:MAG: hypothetical protein AYK23_01850 [Candidatus Proteinoplasmatales archaeon SG8-5]